MTYDAFDYDDEDDMSDVIDDLKELGIELPDDPEDVPEFARKLLELRDRGEDVR